MKTYWQTAVVRIHGASDNWEFQTVMQRPIAPVDVETMKAPWVRCEKDGKVITWTNHGTVTVATDTYTAFLYEKPTREYAILQPDYGVNRGFGEIRYWEFKPDGAVYARSWDGWALYWGPDVEGETEKGGVWTSHCAGCDNECPIRLGGEGAAGSPGEN